MGEEAGKQHWLAQQFGAVEREIATWPAAKRETLRRQVEESGTKPLPTEPDRDLMP